MKKKIYIGCSLTQAPEEFKEAIETLKDNLRADYELLDFIGLVNGTPKDVFEWDINCVKTCDLFVADCTHPAIGLGMEIGVAIENNKPMLIVSEEGARVTRIVLGIDRPNVTLKRYNDHSDVIGFIKEKMEQV
jgi:nucleoside 2-deoxyribosyltransferase